MDLIKRLWRQEDGPSLVDYTLIAVVVTLLFWLGVRGANIGGSMGTDGTKVADCLTPPSSCTP